MPTPTSISRSHSVAHGRITKPVPVTTLVSTGSADAAVDRILAQHLAGPARAAELRRLHNEFERTGFAEIPNFLPVQLENDLRRSLHAAFDKVGRYRNFKNASSDTMRYYYSLSYKLLNAHVPAVSRLYASRALLDVVSRVIGEPAKYAPEPWHDDRYVAHRAAEAGNEHGAHVDPFPYAAVYISKAAPLDSGGDLQFVDVPKEKLPLEAGDVPEVLTAGYPIQTRSPRTNSLYVLSALKKPHYTTKLTRALTKEAARLNVTFSFTADSDTRSRAQIQKIFDEEFSPSYPEITKPAHGYNLRRRNGPTQAS